MYKDVVVNLPFFAEDVQEVTVVRLFVKPGDVISPLSPVMEVETEKAAIEVPVDLEGELIDWYIKPGDQVAVGSPVCSVHSFQMPSSEEFRKFYSELTELLGLPLSSSLDLIRAEIGNIIRKTTV